MDNISLILGIKYSLSYQKLILFYYYLIFKKIRDLEIEKSIFAYFLLSYTHYFSMLSLLQYFKSRIHFSSTLSLLQYFKSWIHLTAPPIGFASSLLFKSKYQSNRMRTAYSCDWAGCSREPNRILRIGGGSIKSIHYYQK